MGAKEGRRDKEKRGGEKGRERRRQRKEMEREKEKRAERGKDIRIVFWNVAGLKNKDRGFWKELEEWEVLVLIEAWIERKEWEKIKEKLSKEYEWKVQGATKRNKKGRAMGGGRVLGIRKDLIGQWEE